MATPVEPRHTRRSAPAAPAPDLVWLLRTPAGEDVVPAKAGSWTDGGEARIVTDARGAQKTALVMDVGDARTAVRQTVFPISVGDHVIHAERVRDNIRVTVSRVFRVGYMPNPQTNELWQLRAATLDAIAERDWQGQWTTPPPGFLVAAVGAAMDRTRGGDPLAAIPVAGPLPAAQGPGSPHHAASAIQPPAGGATAQAHVGVGATTGPSLPAATHDPAAPATPMHSQDAPGAAREAAASKITRPVRRVRRVTSRLRTQPAASAGGHRALLALLGTGAAVALLIAGVLLGGALRPARQAGAPVAAAPAASTPSRAGAGHPPAPTGQAQNTDAAATAEAAADDSTAQRQESQATAAAAAAQGLLQSAQTAAASVARLSAATLARNPSARDPQSALPPLQQDDMRIVGVVNEIQQAAAAAATAAQSAARIAKTDAGAAAAASGAQAAQSRTQAALAEARTAGAEIGRLLARAESEVQAWKTVHAAPAGYFGALVEDPPASFGVQGCEVVTADPGSPAAGAGLIGRTQRTDPVGDVITSITDATDGGAVWPVTDCATLNAALQETRAGDRIAAAYYYRQVIWYEVSGRWVLESGTATLTAAPGSSCPAALVGTITPVLTGNRIELTIDFTGPAGTRSGMGVMLDTGGVQSYFPNSLLQSLGYRPFLPTLLSGIVPGAIATADLYRIPASAITVDDHGRFVPLATGTLTVEGIAQGAISGLGPDILKQGAKLTTAGSQWTLTPPCQ